MAGRLDREAHRCRFGPWPRSRSSRSRRSSSAPWPYWLASSMAEGGMSRALGRAWARLVLAVLGVRVDVRGAEHVPVGTRGLRRQPRQRPRHPHPARPSAGRLPNDLTSGRFPPCPCSAGRSGSRATSPSTGAIPFGARRSLRGRGPQASRGREPRRLPGRNTQPGRPRASLQARELRAWPSRRAAPGGAGVAGWGQARGAARDLHLAPGRGPNDDPSADRDEGPGAGGAAALAEEVRRIVASGCQEE